ncbi:hypothetical protein L484_027975 [Morus notabilis]|uniref:Uncharacterized protein n=1 Tax=Morus notabilis TaxID=981085 RepID=W9SW60_9ROSA|nr:hypothetical protein L484_027975 [Morus notabilis]
MACLMGLRRTGFTAIWLHFAKGREDTMTSSCWRSRFAEIWLVGKGTTELQWRSGLSQQRHVVIVGFENDFQCGSVYLTDSV